MIVKEIEQHDDSWVALQRRAYKLLINKEITLGAYILYPHICMTTSMYGISVVSIDGVRDLLFKNKKSNTILKYFHELKNHRLIHFEERTGKSGPFEVLVMNTFLPGKKTTNPSNYFPDVENEVTSSNSIVASEVTGINPKLKSEESEDIKTNKILHSSDKIIGNNNDNDKYKNKLNIDISNKGEYECINLTNGFKPKNWEEGEIKNMATTLKDGCLDYYLKRYREGHFWALEQAFTDYKEIRTLGDIVNPPAWFNNRVETILGKKKDIGKPKR